ncbi:efflux RND transporter periplasmic adaptor subunit [Sulfurimonas sp.]|uniref:efflux RND transporter periplasmic adaptor subunit n=1 Tax=Sulfurimonas sp. TaxID=2022749 RepID=UPI002614888D|nr:efflux RND transporter periplasmic adaptor subunit [Sulfurimonas sp.]
MKKILILVIVIAIVATAGLFLKSQKKAVQELPIAKVYHYNVETVKPSTKTLQETRHFLAQLLASKSALIASKFSAQIKHIYVKENDIVKKGQLLIALDDAEIKASIASLQQQKRALSADVKNAKRTLQRNKKLLEAEAISKEKYDASSVLYQNKYAALQTTDDKINQLHAQAKYLNITAPFSGRVGSVLVDAGNLAVPGKPIISLNSDDQKLIFSYIQTSKPIVQGQTVLINNKEIGQVTRCYDDAKNAMLVAEIKPYKALAYANKSFINIDVVVDKATGCAVPLNALLHRKKETVLMVYNKGQFQSFNADIILQDNQNAILRECPTQAVATAAEAKLALLPTLGKMTITEAE